MREAATRGASLRNKLQLVQARAPFFLRDRPIKIDRTGIRVVAVRSFHIRVAE